MTTAFVSSFDIPGVYVDRRVHSRILQRPLACPRAGVMVHYDDSSSDEWSLKWFQDPKCENGYTWLLLDDGELVELAAPTMRTPHAGPCLVKNANSRYYGIACATNGRVPATPAQLERLTLLIVALFRHHRWSAAEVDTRLVGHDEEAVWTADYTADRSKWGQLGRKVDPTGVRKDGRRIVDMHALRADVRSRLSGTTTERTP